MHKQIFSLLFLLIFMVAGLFAQEVKIQIDTHEMARFDGKTLHLQAPDGSIFIGENAGNADDGTNNHSTAVGFQALANDTSGWNNTAFGYHALSMRDAGDNNVAVGGFAMHNTQYGDFNVAIGQSSMLDNLSGASTVAVGYQSLRYLKSGFQNVAVGYKSMLNSENTSFNTAIGAFTLAKNKIGRFNTAIGRQALSDNLDSLNTAIGDLAGSAAFGAYNTFLGARAGQVNTGNWNVMIGHAAGQNNTESHRLYLDNTNTTAPLLYGEFDNNYLQINGALNINNKYTLPTGAPGIGKVLKYNGGSVVQWSDDETDDADADPNNEIQSLSYNNGTLSLTDGGGSVDIMEGLWEEGNNEIYYDDQDVAIGTSNAEAKLHVRELGTTPALKIEQSYTGSQSIRGAEIFIPSNSSGTKTGLFVQNIGGSSTASNGIFVYSIAGVGDGHAAISTQTSGASTAIKGRALDGAGKAAEFIGTSEFQGRTYFDGNVGIGTENPLSNLHVHDADNDLSRMYVTPRATTSEDSSMLFLAEDSDASFGMYWLYDGVGNDMELWGKANDNVYGPHMSVDRTDGLISLKDNNIIFDPDVNGAGRVITDEIEIRGGSDLAEYFSPVKIEEKSSHLKAHFLPGEIVCVAGDEGEIDVSRKANDQKVIGVVSGANGVKTGMFLGQKGTLASGEIPIAITGRVYVKVNDQNGKIGAGDFITTSDVAGEAMKVSDFNSSQGAILGKALTKEWDGFVLVLIGLQ